MNLLWGFMILIGVIFGAVNGGLGTLTEQILSSVAEAVNLSIAMAGAIALWTGIMEIAEQTGIISGVTRALHPLLHFLFPTLEKEGAAKKQIATNFIANFFGLGWAATPAGLAAMKELRVLRRSVRKDEASDEMCTFLVMNISSLQLIPINMIAYRTQYGSTNPAIIVGPGIAATFVSTAVAFLICKIITSNHTKKRVY